MIFNMSVRCKTLLWKANPMGWRVWRPQKFGLHSSSACTSSGLSPGPPDRSTELSTVSDEKPPHIPVMLKEVLHYLDIQRGQVCFHSYYMYKLFDFLRMYYCLSVFLNVQDTQNLVGFSPHTFHCLQFFHL